MSEQQQTTIKLAGTEIDKEALYLVDFSKISSVNDLVKIFACIGFTFSPYHPHFDELKPFLNLENPLPIPGQPQQPVKSDLNLPKLKQL